MDHQPRSTDESSFINEFIVLILVRNPHHLKTMFPKVSLLGLRHDGRGVSRNPDFSRGELAAEGLRGRLMIEGFACCACLTAAFETEGLSSLSDTDWDKDPDFQHFMHVDERDRPRRKHSKLDFSILAVVWDGKHTHNRGA
jgi:hypothetical protein